VVDVGDDGDVAEVLAALHGPSRLEQGLAGGGSGALLVQRDVRGGEVRIQPIRGSDPPCSQRRKGV
jgi:hypothetical protein